MAPFARNRRDLFSQFIPMEHEPPSHDTFSRVLRTLDPATFNVTCMPAYAGAAQRQPALSRSPHRRLTMPFVSLL
jgi:hypothetical protein